MNVAQMLALMGMALVRFGGRGGEGFAFLLSGLLAVGLVAWALMRVNDNGARNSNR
jgi:chromate transport protein ChrA